jgi:5-dehydro-4-deoxyglucarate dehydratase
MKPRQLRERLSGVIAFPITPFNEDLSLDLKGLRRNLNKLLEHPISAIVAAGGTGEMYSLSPQEHLQVVKETIDAAARRVPVIAGVGFGHRIAVELAREAAAGGADGILAFPPYYPQADDDGLISYYSAIGDATSLDLLIYSRDWANFSPAVVDRLSRIKTLTAWKDGQGDIRRLQLIMNKVGDRLHWIGGAGDDLVPGYYSLGIRTFTSSIATVAPRLSLKLHETAANLQQAELTRLMSEYVAPLYALRTRRKGYEVSAMKTLMDLAGLSGGPVRPPLVNVRPDEREELKQILVSWHAFL